MNDLLPKKEELKPIEKPLNTFYECGFNADFNSLSEQQKLQIICDIVRETIYPDNASNPKTELKELKGDDYTACEIASAYLKELGLCRSVKHVFARKRPFDLEDTYEVHNMLIVEGQDKSLYQMIPSQSPGYKHGVVQLTLDPIFDHYIEVNDQIKEYIKAVKEVSYLHRKKKMDTKIATSYIDRCVMLGLDYPMLREYSTGALRIIVEYLDPGIIKDRIREIIKENSTPKKGQEEARAKKLEKQIEKWREELEELKITKSNPHRQLELSQWIIQEGKRIHPEQERVGNIDNEQIRLSQINPRVLYERGLNTLFIKTSAYFLNCQDELRDAFLEKYHKAGEYQINLSKPTEQTGVKPMLFSHPLGENCARSLDGRTDVILVKADPDSIYKKKKELRNKICGPLWGKELIWFDGKPILWDPMITNIMHGTDHAPEAALHYLVGYPEHQSMTRFMYPNPKLKYKTYTKS